MCRPGLVYYLPTPPTFVVSSYEAQYVFVSEHFSVVYLGLSDPRVLVESGEDFHGHLVTSPQPQMDVSEPALTNLVGQLDLLGDTPLDEEGKTRSRPRTRQSVVNQVFEG